MTKADASDQAVAAAGITLAGFLLGVAAASVVVDGISQLGSTDGLSHLAGALNLAGGVLGVAIGLWAAIQGWRRYRRPGGGGSLVPGGVAVLATTLYVTFAVDAVNVVLVVAAVASAIGLLVLVFSHVLGKGQPQQ